MSKGKEAQEPRDIDPEELLACAQQVLDSTNADVELPMHAQSHVIFEKLDFSSPDILKAIQQSTTTAIHVIIPPGDEMGTLTEKPDFLLAPYLKALRDGDEKVQTSHQLSQRILEGIFSKNMNQQLAGFMQKKVHLADPQRSYVRLALDLWQRTLAARTRLTAEIYCCQIYDLLEERREAFRLPFIEGLQILDGLLDELQQLHARVFSTN